MNASAALVGVRPFSEGKEKPERLRPLKPLPSDRVGAPNQLNILKAWKSVSQNGTRAATVNEVARAVTMAASTVAMTNPFFASIGLLQRLAVGTYVPSNDVLAAFPDTRNPEAALSNLGRAFRQAWFGQALIPRLSRAPMKERAVIALLEEIARSGPEHRKALGVIVELMAAVGIIERDAAQIRLITNSTSGKGEAATIVVDEKSGPSRISIHVDLATWAPEQVAAFFDALTKALSAKGDK